MNLLKSTAKWILRFILSSLTTFPLVVFWGWFISAKCQPPQSTFDDDYWQRNFHEISLKVKCKCDLKIKKKCIKQDLNPRPLKNAPKILNSNNLSKSETGIWPWRWRLQSYSKDRERSVARVQKHLPRTTLSCVVLCEMIYWTINNRLSLKVS